MAKENLSNYPLVSIIIPLYVICERFFKDLLKFQSLDYPYFEILIVSDKKVGLPPFKNAKLILTDAKKSGPAKKRDLALKHVQGEICAFIDDDAYPHHDWLKNAVVHFENQEIVAVGGPGITPKEDTSCEQISGLVYESMFCSGSAQNRFLPLSNKFVVDWPAYNLLVRTSVLKKINGYGVHYYGGEDTFLCMKLLKYGKILYEGQAVVYHHRRKLFFDLPKQIANIGLHRGYFFKKYPQTSRKWFYLLPSLLMLSLFLFLTVSLAKPKLLPIFFISLLFFILLGASTAIKKTQRSKSIFVGIGIILVHITYGLKFIQGLLTKNLER